MPDLIFMYGYPASGKTTYAKRLADNGNRVYLAADEIRRQLYGSQDAFGNPEEIYKILLKQMILNLQAGRSVVYDACNLYRSYRLDYLKPIQQAGIECRKTIIRINSTKTSCLKNHAQRDRNFDIKDVEHYFDINEYPSKSEGWDGIHDVSDFRLDTSVFSIIGDAPSNQNAAEALRSLGHSVSLPDDNLTEDPETAMRLTVNWSNITILLDNGDTNPEVLRAAAKLAKDHRNNIVRILPENHEPTDLQLAGWPVEQIPNITPLLGLVYQKKGV